MLAFDLVKETQKGQRCMRDSALVTSGSLFLSPTSGSWARSGQQSVEFPLILCVSVFKVSESRICSMPLKIRLIVLQRSDSVK